MVESGACFQLYHAACKFDGGVQKRPSRFPEAALGLGVFGNTAVIYCGEVTAVLTPHPGPLSKVIKPGNRLLVPMRHAVFTAVCVCRNDGECSQDCSPQCHSCTWTRTFNFVDHCSVN